MYVLADSSAALPKKPVSRPCCPSRPRPGPAARTPELLGLAEPDEVELVGLALADAISTHGHMAAVRGSTTRAQAAARVPTGYERS